MRNYYFEYNFVIAHRSEARSNKTFPSRPIEHNPFVLIKHGETSDSLKLALLNFMCYTIS